TFKICKWSSAAAIRGSSFTFSAGGSILSAIAGTQATPGCSGTITVQPGATITVTEFVPAGEVVAGVTGSANLTINSVSGGVVSVTVGTGANVLTFENEASSPPQGGFLEVCKDSGDQFTTGTFTFTVTDPAGVVTTVSVLAGQCTGPIPVKAGNVSVAE